MAAWVSFDISLRRHKPFMLLQNRFERGLVERWHQSMEHWRAQVRGEVGLVRHQ
jgi:hypothetical protein